MFSEILLTLLNRPVQSEKDIRPFALRIALICFVAAIAVDTAIQVFAFGGWPEVIRGWLITFTVVAIVAFPIGGYIATTRLEHHNVKTKLIEQSLSDGLTGLKNRTALPIDFEAMSDRSRILVLLSTDRFKTINERFGHLVGDRVLIRVARLIAEELANLGSIYRTDGTEFTLLIGNGNLSETKAQVLALLARVEAANLGTLERPVNLTLSAGIAEIPAGTAFSQAFATADAALEAAKAGGRSRLSLATDLSSVGIVEGDEVMWNIDQQPKPRRRAAPV